MVCDGGVVTEARSPPRLKTAGHLGTIGSEDISTHATLWHQRNAQAWCWPRPRPKSWISAGAYCNVCLSYAIELHHLCFSQLPSSNMPNQPVFFQQCCHRFSVLEIGLMFVNVSNVVCDTMAKLHCHFAMHQSTVLNFQFHWILQLCHMPKFGTYFHMPQICT